MRWLFAFGWLPVPVFYVGRLFAGGFAPLVCIFILAKYREDEGLHQHELEHVEQFWRLWLGLAAVNVPLALFIADRFTLPLLAPDVALWSVGATVAGLCACAHAVLYFGSRDYRLWAEVAAFRRQIACYGPGASIEFAVRALVENYRLGITPEEARRLLEGHDNTRI